MNKNTTKTSKFLSLLLRHKPETIGLTLDDEGWALISDVTEKSGMTLSSIVDAVADNNKQRFKISDDGTKIRANQGHSVDVDLKLEAKTPPEILYHGTATKSLDPIFRGGLKGGKRQHVHLSADTDTAIRVGTRHGHPIVLTVYAKKMFDESYVFFLSDNGVWLTDRVPVYYLEIPGLNAL